MAGSGVAQLRDDDDIVLSVENLVMEFSVGRNEIVHAVSDVSFDVKKAKHSELLVNQDVVSPQLLGL